jgi:hypothetical protein
MNTEDFIKALKEVVIDDHLEMTINIYENSDIQNVTDPYYIEALKFFYTLNAAHKDTLFKIIRQSKIDATSTILGIIDGSSTLIAGNNPELQLLDLTNPDMPEKLSGELQDTFLYQIEMEEKQ